MSTWFRPPPLPVLAVAVFAYIGYGLASSGWMIYVMIVIGSLGGLAGPAVQSLISNSVGDDEQGTMQGAITSLESISGIIGPLIATQLFSHFIDAKRAFQVPGAPFFSAAIIGLLALLVAMKARRVHEASA